jgi:Protein of unknown function (DUF3499)
MRNTRAHRLCSRAGCRHLATKTLTYIYSDSTAVLGQLATFAEPHAYDLCDQHTIRLSAPVGWTFLKEEASEEFQGPSDDDLMAIADAVREAGAEEPTLISQEIPAPKSLNPELGRRGHLRAIPN